MRTQKKTRKRAERRLSSTKRILIGLGVAVAALVAVIVSPSPVSNVRGGVELIGTEPQAEIFGPELPENAVGGYTAPSIQSVLLTEAESEEEVQYVYALDGQKNYHLGTCRFAYASAHRITPYEAYYLGYTPAKCCGAPAYVPAGSQVAN